MTAVADAGRQHELFEAQALRAPHAPAVAFKGVTLTYAELDARANRLAHHLRAGGVGPEVLVGVCLERSLDLAVALLAILKAGGACVPLDPSYPADRLSFLVDDAALATVLTTAALAPRLAAIGAGVIRLDDDAGEWASHPSTPPTSDVGPDNVAYVIYTSGSTGVPKGVLLTHRNLVDHHRTAAELYALGPGDRVLQFCSIGFDASIEEIFPTWAAGATLVLRSDDVPILGRGWLAWLRSCHITVLNLPTGYWHEWAGDLDRLGELVPDDVRIVIVGGERAQGPAYRRWLRVGGRRPRWVNAYGPTEATCMSTVYERPEGRGADDVGDGDPPIGRPLPNTTVRIVDERGDPVPLGTPGELLLGGTGLARGYLNRPELTAERFVVAEVDGSPTRLYRTGDLVMQLDGGDLQYVGRLDGQVKIRGFRVECGEVEAVLSRHPAVAQAVVIAREDAPGDRRLAAYVVAAGADEVLAGELRRFLSDRLPDHMVPSSFTTLEALPLTAHGKVDRAGLPTPDPAGPIGDRPRVDARTTVEQRLAAIWAGVLGVDASTLSVDDDFFEVGGHSLLATQVIAQVREEFGTDTPLRAIFEAPTVAGLAALVAGANEADAPVPALTARPPGLHEPLPLSLAQEQMWGLELEADPPGLYNVTAMRPFARPVDEDALRAALDLLVDRHETLRTSVVATPDGPRQVVAPSSPVELAVTDLGAVPAGDRRADLQRRIAEQDATPFSLDRPPLFRAQLVHLGDEPSLLVVTFDHLICDGTAVEIFVTELVEVYRARSSGRLPELPALDIQFADFATWQRRWLTEDVLRAQLDWWAAHLEGAPFGPAVAFDRIPSVPTRRISSRHLTISPDRYQILQHLARETSSSLFVVCTAAVQALFGRFGGTTDIVLSTTLSGRHRAELEGLIGMFAGVGRIRTDLSGDPTFTEVVGRARASVLGLFEHQDVPFMRVRKALWPDFPTDLIGGAAVLPIELGYFHAPARTSGQHELFFRGQLHPLSITLVDDGAEIRGELSYKLDFYEDSTIDQLVEGWEAVLDSLGKGAPVRLSSLPVPVRAAVS